MAGIIGEDEPLGIEMPTDRPRRSRAGFDRHGIARATIPASVRDRAASLAREEDTTISVILLAVYAAFAHRHTSQARFAIATSITGNDRDGIDFELTSGSTFRHVVRRTRDTLRDPRREDRASTPRASIAFAFARPETTSADRSFELTLDAHEKGDGIALALGYATALFDATTAERFVERYVTLVDAVITQPDARVSALPVMSNAERHRVLVEWNATGAPAPSDAGIVASFEAQATRTPDAIAVEHHGRTLTYDALDRAANRLARVLRRKGVRRGSFVAVLLERAPSMIVAMLAILKAGGAYVPIDPTYPRERIAAMLRDVGEPIIIGQRHLLAEHVDLPASSRLDVDDATLLGAETDDRFPAVASAGDLAFVFFTSGSTGRPKGTCITQRGVTRLVLATNYMTFRPEHVVAQVSNASFDAATWEIWGALLNGSRLVILDKETVIDASALAEALRTSKITAVFLTTALFNQVAELRPDAFASLTHLIFGGEQVNAHAVRRVLPAKPRHLLHAYGPTETTTFATVLDVVRVDPDDTTIPIGRPIGNTTIYVLDENLEPVVPGAPGELCVGGAGNAIGYWGRPELTAERFIPDPFGTTPGSTLYRTGDVVRQRNDGAIEFIGRVDRQVKIRGFRIELGEIDAALASLDGVSASVVLARDDGTGQKQLVAYLVAEAGASLDVAAVRRALAAMLPSHMIPSAFVELDAMPLTPNGKVDRKALPAPDFDASTPEYVPPRTESETLVAAIWRDALRIERIGMHDDFFALGGHSLSAAMIVGRLRQRAGARLSVRSLFEARTPAALAAIVETAPREPEPVAARTEHVAGALTTQESRLWFEQQLDSASVTYNECAAIRVHGALDVDALERAFALLEARHEALRTRYDDVGGEPRRRIVDAGKPAVKRARARDERSAANILATHARSPYDLARDRLWRPVVVDLEDGGHVVGVAMHHIVTDEWSLDLLLRDLGALYDAERHGSRAALARVALDYSDWAATGGVSVSKESVQYFAERLSRVEPLDMPVDRPRPSRRTSDGHVVRRPLGASTRERAIALARSEGTTLPSVLLAIYGALAHRHSGQGRFAVAMPLAGRGRADLETVVGFLVNTVAIDFDFSMPLTLRELVRRTREVVLDAQAHGDASFAEVVDAVVRTRDASRPPLCQIAFAPQPPDAQIKAFGGAPAERFGVDVGVAKFELTLYARETANDIELDLEYATGLFEAETAELLVERYATLLDAALARPDEPIAALPIMSDRERRRVVVEWNETRAPYPRDRSIPSLFAEQARTRPDAVALVFEGRTLSYRELDEASSRVAAALVEAGVRRETHVGISSTRSIEMIVGLLAISKAGGAYVPLDPSYPPERIALLVGEAGVSVVLDPDGSLRLDSKIRSFRTGELASSEGALPTFADPGSRAAAYVLFTSGSTGTPKGVRVEHRSVVRLVRGIQWARITEEDVFFCHAPLAFDASTLEIWGPLLNGAKLVIAPPGVLGIEDLAGTVRREGVTFLWLTAGLFQLVVDHALDSLRGARQLFAGGDVLSTPHVKRVRSALPHLQLVNGYGPTENTTFTTCHAIDTVIDGEPVPIGKPISQTTVYILDAHGEPTPIGVPGELLTGGDGVARGYLRAEATAEKFVPDAFGVETGARLYRTGDIARWRNDGTIEFMGRRDGQVKVRGFRIEVGEIETALLGTGAVREAAVVVREPSAGDKRIVAYVVAGEMDPKALEGALRRSLPDHMIPSAFVRLDALPLTESGKVDRRALPAPDFTAFAAEYVAPRGEAERIIAEVWRDALRVDRVGAHDDFFALGGHSLLATRVAARLRDALSVDVPVRLLFEAPTVERLALRLSPLGVQRGMAAAATIARVERSGMLDASFAQERLWFLEQLDPGKPTYHVPLVLRLRGALHVDALARALSALVARHEALRTTFESVEGQPRQMIHPPRSMELPVEEARDATEARERIRRETERPFDLARDLPIRGKLVKLSEHEHVLVLVMHHIATDGWSLDIVERDLGELYAAHRAGRPPALEDLPVQYADYAAWQRQWLAAGVAERELAYWRTHLAGAPATLDLPSDRPRPPVKSYRGATVRVELAGAATRASALARREAATPFMVLLAAFDILLARHTGQNDVVVGVPIANRTRPEVQRVVGFFVNTLAMRTRLDGDPTFREVVTRVKKATLDAQANQDVPFERIVEALNPPRDMSRTPIFQVMFAHIHRDGSLPPVDGLEVDEDTSLDVAKFDLTLAVEERRGELRASLEYDEALFDRETAERFAERYAVLLDAALASPDTRVAALPLMSEAERRAVVVDWNRTEREYPRETTVHALFVEQARRAPDAVAVVSDRRSLTYRELERESSRLAARLQRLGVGPEVLVAIHLDRSVELAIAALAVLEAGGAYLPLDPVYPKDRLAFMLEDSGAKVLITRADLDHPPHPTIVDISMVDALADGADEPSPSGVRPSNLAYVIYTSGSTGRPKGAMITHRGLSAYLSFALAAYSSPRFGASAVHSSFAFDLTVTSLFVPLLSGKRVVMVPNRDEVDGLARALSASADVTLVKITPAHLEILSQELGADALREERVFVIGGEALLGESLRAFREACPTARLINEYGPTETVVGCCVHEVPPGVPAPGPVPIGRPIANTRMYVLDPAMQPTPPGASGELFIGGEQVGRGYWSRAPLTAERFVPDPFSSVPGARMYRTGDRARWSRDGVLEFLGRIDHQIKLRGYRIELGEIENALLALDTVGQAVVVERSDARGDRHLVAYLVARPDSTIDPDDLRTALATSLPAYMIPSSLVVMDALPLTANGKVDRQVLPDPQLTASTVEYVAPRNATEQTLAEIFVEVLGVARVGIHDDFFALGGHSLLATRVASRIRTRLGVTVSVRVIFEEPTVAGLAHRVASLAGAPRENIARVARDGALPLSFGQEQLWFLQQLDPSSRAYDFPLAYHLSGTLDLPALERAIDELVVRHESLRMRFEAARGAPVLRIDSPKPNALRVVDAPGRPPGEAASEALAASAPFDLARGPLFRPTLLALSAREHVLLLEMHHIVTDGWSAEVLFRDLSRLYSAFARGGPSPLSPLDVQYVDYAAWQRARIETNVIERQLEYWSRHLEGAPPALELPTDRPRPRERTHRGAHEHLQLGRGLRDAVIALAQRTSTTWFMVVLAAYAAVLSRLSGQSDVVVGTPVAQRDLPELEGLVGFFLNNLPVRVRVEKTSFRELLAQVRQTSLDLHANRDVPFDTIVERVKPSRDPSRTPIFQVMLVGLNLPRVDDAFGDVVVRKVDPSDIDAKVELSVYADETADGISLAGVYNLDLFDGERVRELLGEMATFLEAATANPDLPVHRYSLVTPSAKRVLPDPNAPLSDEWRGSVPDVFARVAAEQPQRVAVSDRSGSWTYGELDARANQLAHELVARGVKKGDRVAIAASRSAAQVWATFGVLKAGAAFVMLDLAYPVSRLLQQLDIAQPSALVHVDGAPPWPDEIAQRCEVRIDVPILARGARAFADRPTSRPDIVFAADTPAYIAFTSGSTGVPKGILGTHGPCTHFQPWWCKTFGLTPDDRFSLLSGLAHDPLHRDMFTPLQLGARVCAPKQDDIGTNRLHAWLARERITVLHTTPPLVRLLVDSAPPGTTLNDIRRVFLVGDALTRRDVDRMQALAPNAEMINYYGSTETSRSVSYHLVAPGETSNIVALGRGAEDVQLLVVTSEGLLAGIGELGEIIFRTPHLTAGYLSDEELTRTKFTASPFGSGRAYRTGDLGRYLPSGEVEFAGRGDRQIKVRGFRVELGEVERALTSHPSVRGVLVVSRQDARGDTQIVAYVVPATPSLDKVELRQAVQQRLPDYMVPGAFVFLDAIPLNPNGKVDRGALPDPDDEPRDVTSNVAVAEEGSIAEIVANIWKDVLELDEIDIHANFFDLGGHSLLATRIVAEIEEALGVTISVRSVFESATVAELAAHVEKLMLEQVSADDLDSAVREVRQDRE